MQKIGFGGSCHWCTEAIFLSLKGIGSVLQGWISSEGEYSGFSEAVIVEFDEVIISADTLIAIHLATHSCTSDHQMRAKYRSAIYTVDEDQSRNARTAIGLLQKDYEAPIITVVIPYRSFKLNTEPFLNYYFSDVQKPFCENIINPKLERLLKLFSNETNQQKLHHLIKG
jgi:peptide-methionine (S)-S-oxide reductase